MTPQDDMQSSHRPPQGDAAATETQLEGGAHGMTPIAAPESVRRNWGWLALLGAALIASGLIAITMPVMAGVGVTVVLGAVLIVSGVLQLFGAFRKKGWRGAALHALSGAIYAVGGLALLLAPVVGVVTLSLLIVSILIADGLVRVVMGLRLRPEHGWGWLTAGGAISAALGVLLVVVALPAASLITLGVVAGLSFLMEGVTFLYLAFAARPREDRNHWPDAGERQRQAEA